MFALALALAGITSACIRDWAQEIVDPAAASRGERTAEVYWNVSTWNPYQVVMVKTRLTARPLGRAAVNPTPADGSPRAAR